MSATLAPPQPSSRRLPKTQPSADGLRRLPGVTLFRSGHHVDMHGRAKTYDRDYLAQIVRNFADLKQSADFHHEPPAVLGHEIVQAQLAAILADNPDDRGPTAGGGPSRTDQLAAGWVENLRLGDDGETIIADVERIPPAVADMIDRGQLRFPSVEFRETAKRQDGTDVGPFLHRLALLGAAPPACRSVPPLGQSHFADAPAGVIFFADGGSMADTATAPNADSFNLLLQDKYPDLPPEFFATLTPDQQDLLAKNAVAPPAEDPAATDPNATGYADPTAPPPDFDKAACIDKIIAAEKPADEAARRAELEAMTDAELYALEMKLMGGSPAPPHGATSMADATAELAKVKAFADGLMAKLDTKAKEIDRKAADFQKRQDAALTAQRAKADADWAQAVDAFCDAESASGRIPPAQLDPADPLNLRVRLKAIPADETLCFADATGAEVTKTRREAELEAIRKLPTRQFGDRIPAGKSSDADAAFYDGIRTQARESYAAAHAAPEIPVTQRLGMLPPRHLR